MSGSPWTDAELALLDARYAELGPKQLAALLPGRSVSAITTLAGERGLGRVNSKWTGAEERLLRDHYATAGVAHLQAMMPHKSVEVIRARASDLGVARTDRRAGTDATALIAELRWNLARETAARVAAEQFAASLAAHLARIREIVA